MDVIKAAVSPTRVEDLADDPPPEAVSPADAKALSRIAARVAGVALVEAGIGASFWAAVPPAGEAEVVVVAAAVADAGATSPWTEPVVAATEPEVVERAPIWAWAGAWPSISGRKAVTCGCAAGANACEGSARVDDEVAFAAPLAPCPWPWPWP
jgi:hypothetical protein